MTDLAERSPRFEVRTTATDHFAWLRTRFAVERTMMAWVRSAISLIGFGFAIVQFFERMQQMPGAGTPGLPEAPVYLGLALIGCGILILLVSMWQYRWTLRYLWQDAFAPIAGMTKEGLYSPAIAVAVLLTFIGLFAFAAVLLRLV